jgi:hypothetical protein
MGGDGLLGCTVGMVVGLGQMLLLLFRVGGRVGLGFLFLLRFFPLDNDRIQRRVEDVV